MTLAGLSKVSSAVTAGAVLIAVLAAWLVLAPSLSNISETSQRVGELTAELQSNQLQLQTLRNLTSQEALRERFALLSLAAPARPQLPELLTMVQAIAAKNGMTLLNASPSQIPTGTKLDINLRGGYSGMVGFLESLNKNIRPGRVTNLSVVSQQTQKGESELTVAASVEFVGGAIKGEPQGSVAPLKQEGT